MNFNEIMKNLLANKKERWLVTGAAGFIGSHIAECLLKNNQIVHTLDNFATGKKENIEYLFDVQKEFGGELSFFESDITNPADLPAAFNGVTKVIHQAALGSVPRSIEEPADSHAANVTGFINILNESRNNNIKRVVYASSSSVYGDSQELPKFEDHVGKVLSPYAATKMCNEIYADSYVSCYDMTMVGLRYFNVFGPRQDPNGPYAAVIPKWIDAVQQGESCLINGDGETSRDFCYIYNVVYANIASALIEEMPKKHESLISLVEIKPHLMNFTS